MSFVDMPWSAALLMMASVFGFGSVTVIAICIHFSEERREMRAMRRRHRKRIRALRYLRLTAKRPGFQEFEGRR